MLYVFHVDMGRMMTFDMTVALSSVENLKETIERLHGIPAENIVLLVSGGEMLTKSTQVSYYSAGTDTNPIYMFLTGDVKYPAFSLPSGSDTDIDLREQVDRCLELPAILDTVMKRAQLAQRMYDLAREEEKWCERLVHEQHLQQQGWSAVVANMEDLTDEFRQRFKNFCTAFDRHLENREIYLELLKNFANDLTKLSQIPILPALMSLAEEDFHGFDEFLDTDEVFAHSQHQQESVIAAQPQCTVAEIDSDNINKSTVTDKTSPNRLLKIANTDIEEDRAIVSSQPSTGTGNIQRRTFTLLQWISAKENHNALKLMAEECIQGLGTFNVDVYNKLKSEVQNIIKLAVQNDVKDIKGLGERLCKLEEFKYKIKNMVQDQKELSTAFQQNQVRAINLRDASILPDLCASHQSQLLVMLKNHHKIREHKSCITKAKDELGLNLHMRLKRIVLIENAMSEFDNRLLFYHRCLRRAERHLNIIEQIHEAPSIYVAAVTEVVRRKIFSGEFRKWASKLATDFDTIHSEEIKRRQQFNTRFEGHFLNILFPGMNDMPPAFANENPLIFDARLPNITVKDIDMLSSHLPDLSCHGQLPDMAPVINFFVSRSGEHHKEHFEELLQHQIKQQAIHLSKGGLQSDIAESAVGNICDESETDIEDFEKVKQSEVTPPQPIVPEVLAIEMATSTSEFSKNSAAKSTLTDDLITNNAETLTDENGVSTLDEIERLRGLLNDMSKLSVECLRVARKNVETFRQDVQGYQCGLISELQILSNNCNLLRMHTPMSEEIEEDKERQHISELSRLRKELEEKNADLTSLKNLREEKQELEMKYHVLEEKTDDILKQLKSAEMEKERAIADLRETLIRDHKTEIESLRHRFKLMALPLKLSSLDPQTSEKISQQNDMIDIACHEMICSQIRADMNALKEREITAALEAERSIWQSKIFPVNSESVMANVNVLKDMLEEKEKQLDMLREQDILLTKENYQLKTRLDALTNEDGNSWLREKIEYLNRDKCRLEEELTMERSRRAEMESSVAELRSSIYEQACVVGSLPRSKSSNYSQKYIVLESCNKGDVVLVVWSVRHGQFMVVQDSQSRYFVHGDSLPALNLRFPETSEEGTSQKAQSIPIPYYAIGRVVDKEYCQAKKDENRYRVSRGSKFYRIKLIPLPTKQSLRKERCEHFALTRSVSQSESQTEGTSTSTCNFITHLSLTTGGSSTRTECEPMSSPVTKKYSKDVTDSSALYQSITPSSPLSSAIPKPSTNAPLSIVPYISPGINFKQDDIPVSSLVEPCGFINIIEEEETRELTEKTISLNLQQQSVITEQPTASSTNMQLDLALSSANLSKISNSSNTTDTSLSTTTTRTNAATSSNAIAIPTSNSCSPPSVPASFGTSDDSDEYRSLDAKDGPSFPRSE